jgi:hypothetical protein
VVLPRVRLVPDQFNHYIKQSPDTRADLHTLTATLLNGTHEKREAPEHRQHHNDGYQKPQHSTPQQLMRQLSPRRLLRICGVQLSYLRAIKERIRFVTKLRSVAPPLSER